MPAGIDRPLAGAETDLCVCDSGAVGSSPPETDLSCLPTVPPVLPACAIAGGLACAKKQIDVAMASTNNCAFMAHPQNPECTVDYRLS